MTRPLALLTSLAFAANAAPSLAQGDSGKLSGVFFGDYYSVLDHNNSSIEGKSGFWVRRIYLTYDKKFDDKLSTQLRLEAKDPGDFSTSANMEPFIKDAWLRYTENGYRFTFGLMPTPTFASAEERLGYRAIEKTPLDLYKLGSSRDKGIAVQGALGAGGKGDFTLMFGDGSGTKSSNGETSAIYGRAGYKVAPEIYVDVYADSLKKNDGERWRTWKGELMYQGERVRGGLMIASQRRTEPKAADLNLDVFSAYAEFKASQKFSPFVRLDVWGDAVPDADTIEFWSMSESGKPTLFMFGVRYRVSDAVEVIPSFTTIRYRSVAEGSSPSQDAMFRLTFSAKF